MFNDFVLGFFWTSFENIAMMDAHKEKTLNLFLWMRIELMSIVKIKNIVAII